MEEQKRQYRKFKADQKFKIVKEALTTDTKISELCTKYDVKSSHFYTWQELFYRGAREAFERGNEGAPTKAEQPRIAELERVGSHPICSLWAALLCLGDAPPMKSLPSPYSERIDEAVPEAEWCIAKLCPSSCADTPTGHAFTHDSLPGM